MPGACASVQTMKGNSFFFSLRIVTRLLMTIILPAFLVLSPAAARRIHLSPKFHLGDTFYYQIEMHTISTGKTITPIINAEGGTKFSENVDLLVRLDVLPNDPDAAKHVDSQRQGESDASPIRMRVTYVRAHADSQSDAPSFDTASPRHEYDRLTGHSFEFTIEPGGVISNVRDIDAVLPNSADGVQTLSWMKALAFGTSFPRKGIVIGQKWVSEKPLRGAPLTRLVWRAKSTYLRNDKCRASAASAAPERSTQVRPEQCAVILTQFRILQRGSAHADETPPDYLRHGLRTAGTLTGSGESLDSIALDTGALVSSTQTSTQHVDFDIINAANGERIHRVGQVRTQTIITSVASPPPAEH